MASNTKQKKRILVIGNTGVGKSSIIRYMNAYDKNDKLHIVKRGQRGVTFETTLYHNDEFIFADTTGFGETAEGTVPPEVVLENLVDFLAENIDGFNVILFVTNNDRIEDHVVKTYRIIDPIIPSEIPKILVRTQDQAGAGNIIQEEELERWQLDYCFFCTGCRVSYPDMEELKAKNAKETKIQDCYQDIDLSNAIITKLINEHSLPESMILCLREEFLTILERIMNKIGVYFKWTLLIKAVANFIDMYKKLGYNEKEAKLKAAALQFKLRKKKPNYQRQN